MCSETFRNCPTLEHRRLLQSFNRWLCSQTCAKLRRGQIKLNKAWISCKQRAMSFDMVAGSTSSLSIFLVSCKGESAASAIIAANAFSSSKFSTHALAFCPALSLRIRTSWRHVLIQACKNKHVRPRGFVWDSKRCWALWKFHLFAWIPALLGNKTALLGSSRNICPHLEPSFLHSATANPETRRKHQGKPKQLRLVSLRNYSQRKPKQLSFGSQGWFDAKSKRIFQIAFTKFKLAQRALQRGFGS